ncbi:MAG: hypothetical protein ACYTEW_27160 [Planctomycetota bacterium]|jgi:hypothetical protein
MIKATLRQRLEIIDCQTNAAKIRTWEKFGFTRLEAQMMVRGRTAAQATDEQGGVWQVGNVPYPQAISKEHAQKIHIWNFGHTDDLEDTRLTTPFE